MNPHCNCGFPNARPPHHNRSCPVYYGPNRPHAHAPVYEFKDGDAVADMRGDIILFVRYANDKDLSKSGLTWKRAALTRRSTGKGHPGNEWLCEARDLFPVPIGSFIIDYKLLDGGGQGVLQHGHLKFTEVSMRGNILSVQWTGGDLEAIPFEGWKRLAVRETQCTCMHERTSKFYQPWSHSTACPVYAPKRAAVLDPANKVSYRADQHIETIPADSITPELIGRMKSEVRQVKEERLARLLFVSNPDVQAFVVRRAESLVQARVGQVYSIAWDRDENGWRTDAEARAKDALDKDDIVTKFLGPKTV